MLTATLNADATVTLYIDPAHHRYVELMAEFAQGQREQCKAQHAEAVKLSGVDDTPPPPDQQHADDILEQAIEAARNLSKEVRRKVRELSRREFETPSDLLTELRKLIGTVTPRMAKTIGDAVLASWLVGQRDVVRKARIDDAAEPFSPHVFRAVEAIAQPAATAPPTLPPAMPSAGAGAGEPPTTETATGTPDDGEPDYVFPLIETAANSLARKQVMTAEQFYAAAAQARQVGFTVSHVASEDTIAKVQDALIEDIQDGGTLRAFQDRMADIVDVSPLSESHVETIYRTNIANAYSEAQKRILEHPLVATEFPYVEYHAAHDGRVRRDHLEMEHLGINGTNIYRADDPVIRKFWPPWSFNCRCVVVPIPLEVAAERGIPEAVKWQETGVSPVSPSFVAPPPFDLPPGWVSSS